MNATEPLSSSTDLSLSPDAERKLCADLRDLEAQLRQVLTAIDATLEVGDAPLDALRAAVGRLRGTQPLTTSARRLLRAIDRLTWRLALSGMDQVEHQLRARRYVRVGRDELRQAGVLGLHKAARRFEPSKGVRFSTYCRYWVQDAMGEAVGRLEYAARLPSKARRQLHQDADTLSRRQAHALDGVKRAVDLDATVGGDDDGQRHGDLLRADPQRWSPEHRVMSRSRLGRLARALQQSDLRTRDRYILTQRFGLGGNTARTNREIGDELGISGERVRQLQKRAVATLRRAYLAA